MKALRLALKNNALRACIAVLLIAAACGQAAERKASKPDVSSHASARVLGVAAIGMTVADMDRSVKFYEEVLSFRKVSDVEVAGEAYEHLEGVFGLRMRVVRLQLGDESLELTEYLAPEGRPIPPDSRSNDRWFQHAAIVVKDIDRGYQWLREHKVRHASPEPQRLPQWNVNAAGIAAFYFKDPDGHVLEIIQFPPDKGDPKWKTAKGELFLGIDHTAIVVNDSAASVRFYCGALGLRKAGESENYGTEQEHLNNVFGAHLAITTLRPAAGPGPGIELLEYLAPRDGRAMPSDKHSNDLIHWQTKLVVADVEAAAGELRREDKELKFSGVVPLPDDSLGFRKALMVADPDGHSMELIQK